MEANSAAVILLLALSITGLSCLVVFIIFQMRSFKRTYSLPDKPIEAMSLDEVKMALQAEELNTARWIEDIIVILIHKNIITPDELPFIVRTKVEYKEELRKKYKSLLPNVDTEKE